MITIQVRKSKFQASGSAMKRKPTGQPEPYKFYQKMWPGEGVYPAISKVSLKPEVALGFSIREQDALALVRIFCASHIIELIYKNSFFASQVRNSLADSIKTIDS